MNEIAFAPTDDPQANSLVIEDPLALLIAMLLDQQIAIELAFKGPLRLKERLGHLDAGRIASTDPDALVEIFRQKPALHRFPGSMAKRAQALCAYLVDEHDGSAHLWSNTESAQALHGRISALPGFGDEKTMILMAVLAKRFGVAPDGWEKYAGAFSDDQPRSVADMDSELGRERVRAWKKQQRADGRSKQD